MAKPALKVVESKASMNKQKALDAALSQIERAFGKGSIMKIRRRPRDPKNSFHRYRAHWGLISPSALAASHVVALSRFTAPESSGKTTLALHIIAEAQKAGGVCALCDAEHALDPGYAHNLHVNLNELLISQPDAGEQALEITDTLVRSGAVDLLVIDSVAGLSAACRIRRRYGRHPCRLASTPDEPSPP